jgi:hypothetical protein
LPLFRFRVELFESNKMSYEDLDVFGRIVVKVKLDDEIRKAAIHNKELTFNELGLMIQRIFSDLINKTDEFTIKYTDEGIEFNHIVPLSALFSTLKTCTKMNFF